jgi:two-component system, NtrC family, nitrogen regulation response regulator GlnG
VSVILYVEDNVDVRTMVAELLATPDRSFVCCGDVPSALAALEAHKIDVVITDLNLPGASGMEIVRTVFERYPQCPVIVCSGHDIPLRAFPDTARVHCVRKPFDVDEVDALLKRL